MDINNIFNLFDKPQLAQTEESQRLVDEFKEHPLVKIGMFKKLILNYRNFGSKLVNSLSKSDTNLNLDDIKKAGEYLLYNKAFDHIKTIDLYQPFHLESLQSVSSPELLYVLKDCISHFEKFEEYEKCAFLQVVQKEVENYLK